jgi:hypothetical protein
VIVHVMPTVSVDGIQGVRLMKRGAMKRVDIV